MYVLDASVILKWFADEDKSKDAIAIRDSHINGEYVIVIPELAVYEIGNALRYKPGASSEEVSRYLNDINDLNLHIISLPPDLLNLSAEIAFQKDLTFYDATYIALAKELGLHLITADKRLYEKAKSLHFIDLL